MGRLAILSDTHIPTRADSIPGWIEEAIQGADHVIHAGDFDSTETYRRIETLASGDLTAVAGNMDPVDLPLPDIDSLTFGGRTFVVFHGTGPTHNYETRIRTTVRDEVEDPDPVAVAGHTHEVLDSTDGIRILNPGSATGAPPASDPSMMVATVEDGELSIEVRRE